MKTIVLVVAVAFMFLGTGAAYGMGGGGSHGDGRVDFLQKPGANDGSATNAQAQDTDRCHTDPSGDPTDPVSAVPEPATSLLLGSGLIGLVGLRRKFRK